MQANDEVPRILALGDSWFCYPANNLLNPIFNEVNGAVILGQGANGAEAEEMVHPRYLKPFEAALKGYPSIKAVLISAGGNDFAGLEDLPLILREDCSAAEYADQCYRKAQPDILLDSVGGFIGTLIDSVRRLRPGARVLLHHYDYAIPDGRGFLGFGQWLKAPMDDALVPKPDQLEFGSLRREIVRMLIDGLAERLRPLAYADPDRVTFIETAGTLKDVQWANELHPTPGGFTRIARRFTPALREALEIP